MKTNNYDFIASWYDCLSRIVFLKSQVNAQKEQLSFIKSDQKILIVGGGTGWILEEIAKSHDNLQITFVEISANMIQLAKQKKIRNNRISFVHLPIEKFTDQQSYDVIITAFLFDNFARNRAEIVFEQLHKIVEEDGLWLFTDFSNNHTTSRWQYYLLKTMYFFFEKVANVEAKQLVAMYPYFLKNNYTVVQRKQYYGNFIDAFVFQKGM
ncbi:class I SAM-dependent methyltransferase [Flavobacterium algicola]|uniref:class I SAM-dependent methyltransferase n=1 Tax=Flavobacterium algicola TaxID=556529 RepID=UPI001EFE8426|nr:class I SAM-dependent methyltransferase [Flavobacterium algicola]MCG9794014.1 class I SAM-dependent methyltransferase [Flavobacterium algicola]